METEMLRTVWREEDKILGVIVGAGLVVCARGNRYGE
jgi:hypothetical protein